MHDLAVQLLPLAIGLVGMAVLLLALLYRRDRRAMRAAGFPPVPTGSAESGPGSASSGPLKG